MTLEQAERYHARNHTHPPRSMAECWRCQHAQSVCGFKVTYASPSEAAEDAKEINENRSYVRPLASYRCTWCDRWHLTSRLSRHRAAQVQRQYRKWATARELARRTQEESS